MPFQRIWDSSCPRIYDSWESSGKQWVIQDLLPEDDESAIQLLKEHLIPDETLAALSQLSEDQESVDSMVNCWRVSIAQRMSLGCYELVNGKKTLVAMNVCVVDSVDDRFPIVEIEGDAWKQVYHGIMFTEVKCDPFSHLGVKTMLHALGLVVKREYRCEKLGSKILAAREPLCRFHGIKATATMFTGPASQRSAARAGFEIICTSSLKELADNGFKFPPDETRLLKLMVKKYE